ncbi:DUF192 domain-containing protein [archaeon]|mgnify:CR=1 FL=1|jgi:uncharacterized protein|nr:DUF192 domain-containing protein [archaeon]
MIFDIFKGNVIIADKALYKKNVLFKVKGLMFSKPLKSGEAIILEAKEEGIIETTLHMLFVFYPIDILWLNKKLEIVDIKRKVLPFKPWIVPKSPAKFVVEMKSGAAKTLKIGDVLKFKPSSSF